MDDPAGGDLSWTTWGRCVLHMLEQSEQAERELRARVTALETALHQKEIAQIKGDHEVEKDALQRDHATDLDVRELMIQARNKGVVYGGLSGGGGAVLVELIRFIAALLMGKG